MPDADQGHYSRRKLLLGSAALTSVVGGVSMLNAEGSRTGASFLATNNTTTTTRTSPTVITTESPVNYDGYPYGIGQTKIQEAKKVVEDAGYGPDDGLGITASETLDDPVVVTVRFSEDFEGVDEHLYEFHLEPGETEEKEVEIEFPSPGLQYLELVYSIDGIPLTVFDNTLWVPDSDDDEEDEEEEQEDTSTTTASGGAERFSDVYTFDALSITEAPEGLEAAGYLRDENSVFVVATGPIRVPVEVLVNGEPFEDLVLYVEEGTTRVSEELSLEFPHPGPNHLEFRFEDYSLANTLYVPRG